MPNVIGIRFKNMGKAYYFDPGEHDPEIGTFAVVETMRGVEIGEIIAGRKEIAEDELSVPLKPIIRIATPEDLLKVEENKSKQAPAFEICTQKIEHHKLQMKLVDVEYTFDGSKIIFYFTANGRVDFRELVKDLASVFHMRIELRQIGVRDEAKMLGGLGPCGRPICCGSFLGDFQPVSIKMAKEQGLSLNPTKISGLCGRLMCCLKYEQHNYECAHKRIPRIGKEVITPDGQGVVIETNVLKETVRVRMHTNDQSLDMRTYPADKVQTISRPGNESIGSEDSVVAGEYDDEATLFNVVDEPGFENYNDSLFEVLDAPDDLEFLERKKPKSKTGNKPQGDKPKHDSHKSLPPRNPKYPKPKQ